MYADVAFHMLLEVIGALVAWYAYGYCSHWRHRVTLWFFLSLFFSIITVNLIG